MRDMSCIFCRIARRELPSHTIYEDETTLAFMDINPGTRGHALVIPKAHAVDVFDVTPEDLAALARTAQKVARAAKDALGCGGVNLVQSSGRVAFQSVFHIHVHVIPRYPDDGVRLPWVPSPGDPAVIAEAAEKLRANL
jgi:histidine triad (HIT) family protein